MGKERRLQARVISESTTRFFKLNRRILLALLRTVPPSPFSVNYPSWLTDGAGLFAGVLKHLLARGSDCPKVIATTHFHELFSTGSGALDPLSQKLPITFVHMEIMFATRGGEIITDAASSTTVTKAENITYLYRSVDPLSILFNSCYGGIHP